MMARTMAVVVCIAVLMAGGAADLVCADGVDCGPAPVLEGCQVFPDDNIWNARVDSLLVSARSGDYVAAIGADTSFHADFGSGTWAGGPIGIPYCVVSGDQAKVAVSFTYDDESDAGGYPIPDDPPIEGGDDSSGDRHILMLDTDNCLLYELYAAYPNEDGTWRAGSGAIYDLGSHDLRPADWTSADAAGLPILPGLVRYDEVASGAITHAIRFTAPRTQRAYVWPARHQAGCSDDLGLPPMGQRFRLRGDFDVSAYSEQVQVIMVAMQRYGIILADNGSSWFLSGAPDERWDNDMLRELRDLQGSDFEAVDVSSLMISADSGQARCGDGYEVPLWLPLLLRRPM